MSNSKFAFVFGLCLASVPTPAPAQTAAPQIENIATGAEQPRLTIHGAAGSTNVIEYRNDLPDRTWWPLTNLVVADSPYVFVDGSAPSLARRYYRVVVPGADYVAATPSNAPAGMVLVPEGWFTMGDSFHEYDIRETPTHEVLVSAFYMDRYEVTKAVWDGVYRWAITNGYDFARPGSAAGENYPVIQLPWYDMVKWCNARSEKEGLKPAYYTDDAHTKVYRDSYYDIENG